jgi:ABC-type transport system involved in cytochrome bd biosynthesis fused ATPase/permease subunit
MSRLYNLDAVDAQQERIRRSAKWHRHEALEALRAAHKEEA